MITYDPATEQAMLGTAGEIEITSFFEISLASGVLRFSTLNHATTESGMQFMPGHEILIGISLQNRITLGGQGMILTLSDNDRTYQQAFGKNYIGTRMQFWLKINDGPIELETVTYCSDLNINRIDAEQVLIATFDPYIELITGQNPAVLTPEWIKNQNRNDTTLDNINDTTPVVFGKRNLATQSRRGSGTRL